MGNRKSWGYAVEQAIASLSAIGVETYHCSETIKASVPLPIPEI
jgi:hypothetical protein